MIPTLSPAEAAAELGCSRSVVYRLVHAGDLTGHRAGGIRIDRASVEAYRRRHGFGEPVRRHRAKPAAMYQYQELRLPG